MDIRIEKKKGIRALFTKKGIPYLAGAHRCNTRPGAF